MSINIQCTEYTWFVSYFVRRPKIHQAK